MTCKLIQIMYKNIYGFPDSVWGEYMLYSHLFRQFNIIDVEYFWLTVLNSQISCLSRQLVASYCCLVCPLVDILAPYDGICCWYRWTVVSSSGLVYLKMKVLFRIADLFVPLVKVFVDIVELFVSRVELLFPLAELLVLTVEMLFPIADLFVTVAD